MPNIIRQEITQRMDPYKKEMSGPFDRIIAATPRISKKILTKIDLVGDPMIYENFQDPSFRSNVPYWGPISDEILRTKVYLIKPRRRRNGIKLTPVEYQAWMIHAGKGDIYDSSVPSMIDELEAVMARDEYQRRSDKGKAALLKEGIALQYRQGWEMLLADPRFDVEERIHKAKAEAEAANYTGEDKQYILQEGGL